MLKVYPQHNHPTPVLACDRCKEPIKDHHDGEWVYYPNLDGLENRVFVYHQKCTPTWQGDDIGRFPLDSLLVLVGENLGIKWNRARETALEMGDIAA